MDIDVLGSYNTLKATIPELVKSAANSKTSSKFTFPLVTISFALISFELCSSDELPR